MTGSHLTETEFYQKGGMGERVHAWEDLKVQGTEQIVSTEAYIRKGLQGIVISNGKQAANAKARPVDQEPGVYTSFQAEQEVTQKKNYRSFVSRAQCRVVLNIWGFPIKYFKDLKELLCGILGAVMGMWISVDFVMLHHS